MSQPQERTLSSGDKRFKVGSSQGVVYQLWTRKRSLKVRGPGRRVGQRDEDPSLKAPQESRIDILDPICAGHDEHVLDLSCPGHLNEDFGEESPAARVIGRRSLTSKCVHFI